MSLGGCYGMSLGGCSWYVTRRLQHGMSLGGCYGMSLGGCNMVCH